MTSNHNACRWLSKPFENLVNEHKKNPDLIFDVIIVGSGYGGSIAAAEISQYTTAEGDPLRICVLERGKEYLPGMFPSRFSDMPAHVRFTTDHDSKPKGLREGLFDVRIGSDVSVVLANGLGGGSLINAGVMEKPRDDVFNDRWPKEIQRDSNKKDDWDYLFQEAKQLVGAIGSDFTENTIFKHQKFNNGAAPDKYRILEKLGKTAKNASRTKPVSLSIAMNRCTTSAGVELDPCLLCGDCATGCNHNAKESLDTNLLVKAWQNGVEIYTGVTINSIEQSSRDEWVVNAGYTNKNLQNREKSLIKIKSKRVIISAGSLGSTEILQRSTKPKSNSPTESALSLSKRLGHRFSSNGDMLAVGFNQEPKNPECKTSAVANEDISPHQRNIGPTITGLLDLSSETDGFSIEEMAVPGALRTLFEELFTSYDLLHGLNKGDKDNHSYGHPHNDPLIASDRKTSKTSLYAIMGNDDANGQLLLKEDYSECCTGGAIKIDWGELKTKDIFKSQIKMLNNLTKNSKVGGSVIANPSWSFLPSELNSLIDSEKNRYGPLLTVHPLGGCAMADTVDHGVVNHCGQVFFASKKDTDNDVYPGLVVLDGAIIPSALEINPALTIAALSLRAVRILCNDKWKLKKNPTSKQQIEKTQRPRFRKKTNAFEAMPTELGFIERLSGEIFIPTRPNHMEKRIVEITLAFKPKSLSDLIKARNSDLDSLSNASLNVDPCKSNIRIFTIEAWKTATTIWDDENQTPRENSDLNIEDRLSSVAEFSASLNGSISLFKREKSSLWKRRLFSGYSWFLNRGLRDIWQSIENWMNNGTTSTFESTEHKRSSSIIKKAINAWNLASKAGEVRLIEYNLTLNEPSISPQNWSNHAHSKLLGRKRFTYSRKSNPLRQLMEVDIYEIFGRRQKSFGILSLDTKYLARREIPLFHITKQQDLPTALSELISLGGFMVRLFLSIHLWTFRKPDSSSYIANPWPGKIDGLPDPVRYEITNPNPDQCGPYIPIYLTRYKRREGTTRPPVLCIHGYTTSGKTFAHNKVKPNLTSHLWKEGWDVWIVELRNSPALKTAKAPWTYDQIAMQDVPAAINRVLRETGMNKIDIVAHCIGAAMFSMAILKQGDALGSQSPLSEKINRVVLSQVSPFVVFSPSNVFRAYIFKYLRHFFPNYNYEYRAGNSPSTFQQMLNRLLAALPYPETEFNTENPLKPWKKTPFVELRHRMDALYGRAFSVNNLSEDVLNKIDDLFGAPNLDSIFQTIHFARQSVITNSKGRNTYVTRRRLNMHWSFPTLSVHGDQNGLSDVSTLDRSMFLFDDANVNYKKEVCEGFGHQDSFIGKDAHKVSHRISKFLGETSGTVNSEENTLLNRKWIATTPFLGPFPSPLEKTHLTVRLGSNPTYGQPLFTVFANVIDSNGKYVICDSGLSGHRLYVPFPWNNRPPREIDGVDTSGWTKYHINNGFFNEIASGVLSVTIYDQNLVLDNFVLGFIPTENMMDLLDQDIAPGLKQLLNKIPETIDSFLDAKSAKDLERGIFATPFTRTRLSQNHLRFIVGSCQYPAGLIDNVPAYSSFSRIDKAIDTFEPEFLLLLGDQVYVDATAGLFDPTSIDDRFRLPYEKLFSNPHVRSVFQKLPVYAIPDDHEIHDNWEPGNPSQNNISNNDLLKMGIACYRNYFEQHPAPQNTWQNITSNGFPFFFADTRTERRPSEGRTASNIANANIMSDGQHHAIEQWLLSQPRELPKFIASQSMLLPRHLCATGSTVNALRSDSWDGYPHSLNRLLKFIIINDIKNVVFLSGDEHISNVTHALISHPNGSSSVIHSIHSSGLYSPLPFANAVEEDFVSNDHFSFSSTYSCKVIARYFPGDGFAQLETYRDNDQWYMRCSFERGINPSEQVCFIIGTYPNNT